MILSPELFCSILPSPAVTHNWNPILALILPATLGVWGGCRLREDQLRSLTFSGFTTGDPSQGLPSPWLLLGTVHCFFIKVFVATGQGQDWCVRCPNFSARRPHQINYFNMGGREHLVLDAPWFAPSLPGDVLAPALLTTWTMEVEGEQIVGGPCILHTFQSREEERWISVGKLVDVLVNTALGARLNRSHRKTGPGFKWGSIKMGSLCADV